MYNKKIYFKSFSLLLGQSSYVICAVHILAVVIFLIQLSLFSEVSTLTFELRNLGVLRDTGRIWAVCVAGL